MNAALLTRVRRTIVRDPDQFCAAQWAFARNAAQALRHAASPEGFRCCIAGHVLLEAGALSRRGLLREGGFHTGGGVWTRAARVAELDDHRARALFFPSQWERPYKQRYYLCDQEEEASLAGAYLEYFVDEYGPPVSRRFAETTAGERAAARPGDEGSGSSAPRRARVPA